MKEMKTLTVNGVTYAVTDPNAARIDDSTVGMDAWSGKNIIDRLCPAFTESGAAVTCEPVEGYPLDVVWESKNLINPAEYLKASQGTTLDGDVFTTTTTSGTLFVNHWWEGTQKTNPAGTYTITVVPVSDNVNIAVIVYANSNRSIITNFQTTSSVLSKTFTANEEFFVAIGGGDSAAWGTHSYKLQLEKGSTATAFESYAETATITRCGKNLFNPANTLAGYIQYATTGTTIMSSATAVTVYARCKPNTTYTVSKTPGQRFCVCTAADVPNVGDAIIAGIWKETEGSITITTPATAKYLVAWVYNSTIDTGITKEQMLDSVQIEEGAATAYESYSGGTFVPGDTIPALPGINTIFADTGLVTVTGRADLNAINKKTAERLAALEAALVNT